LTNRFEDLVFKPQVTESHISVPSQSLAADFQLTDDQWPMGCVYYLMVWGSDAYLRSMKSQSDLVAREYCTLLTEANDADAKAAAAAEPKKDK
jgi:hypothetical protein